MLCAAVTHNALRCYGPVTKVDSSYPLGLEDDGSNRNIPKKSPGKSRMSSRTQFIPRQSTA